MSESQGDVKVNATTSLASIQDPVRSDPTTAELWQKLQSQGLLTSRESAISGSAKGETPQTHESEEVKKNRIKLEAALQKVEAERAHVQQYQDPTTAGSSLLMEGLPSTDPPKRKRKRKRASEEDADAAITTDEANRQLGDVPAGAMEPEKPKRKRDRTHGTSILCTYLDPSGNAVSCKQRAILAYRYCIRHILHDPEAPYQQCQHHRKPKTKKDAATRCTNAIRKDIGETYCSTHLIMQGLKEAKKKSTSSTVTTSVLNLPDHSTASTDMTQTTGPESAYLSSQPGCSSLPAAGDSHRMTSSSSLLSLEIPAASMSALGQALASPETKPIISAQYQPGPVAQLNELDQFSNHDSQLMKALTSTEDTTNDASMPSSSDHLAYSMPTSSVPLNFAPSADVETTVGQMQHFQHPVTQSGSVMLPPTAPPMHPPPGVCTPTGQATAPKGQQLTPEQCEQALARMTPEQRSAFEKHRVLMAQRRAMAATGPTGQAAGSSQQRGGGAGKLPPHLSERVDNILRRLTPHARTMWMASLASRTGSAMRQGKPFPFQVWHKRNPQMATRMFRASQYRFPRPVLRPPVDPATVQMLPWAAPPIRPASPSSSSEDEDFDRDGMPKQRMIRLRQKRQQKKMVGPYRNIPQVDYMCRLMEDADFDRTDLFPLGLEPSDDEDDMGPSFQNVLPPAGFTSLGDSIDAQNELYLIKKQLKLERHALLKAAQLNAPVMNAAKRYPTSVGAALLQRVDSEPPPPQMLLPTLRRCCQVENKMRCERSCLPSSNHCKVHVLYNVNQRMFSFCTQSFCRRPVVAVDVLLWDGKCKLHREPQVDKYGAYPVHNGPARNSAPQYPQVVRERSPTPVDLAIEWDSATGLPIASYDQPAPHQSTSAPKQSISAQMALIQSISVPIQPLPQPPVISHHAPDLDYISEFLLGEGFPISPGIHDTSSM